MSLEFKDTWDECPIGSMLLGSMPLGMNSPGIYAPGTNHPRASLLSAINAPRIKENEITLG